MIMFGFIYRLLTGENMRVSNNESKLAILISVFSLCIAFFTFYKTEFSNPDVSVEIGPKLVVAFVDDALNFIIPMSFTNSSHAYDVVKHVSLTISKRNVLDENYFMDWDSIYKLNEYQGFIHTELASTTPVLGKGFVQKLVSFKWSNEFYDFNLEKGDYKLRFDVWTKGNNKPSITKILDLKISDDKLKEIESKKKDLNGVDNVVYLVLNEYVNSNRVLKDYELKELME